MGNRSLSTLRRIPTVTTVSPSSAPSLQYLNGFSALVGKTESVSYHPDDRRRRPSDLFASGTGMVFQRTVYLDPIGTKYHSDASASVSVMAAASHTANAGYATQSDELPSVIGESRNSLLKKLKDQNLNLAVSLGEFRSTANTVGDLARSVARVLVQPKMRLGLRLARKFRSRFSDPRFPKRTSTREKDAVNAYLGYTYGLVPVLSDITGSLSALNKRLEKDYYAYVQSSAKRVTSKSVALPMWNDPVFALPRSASSSKSYSVRTKARFRIDSNVKALAEVGITNPALAAYELVPYSFVLDWIIPVGDYLSSLDALTGVSELTWFETYLVEETMNGSTGHGVTTTYKARTASQNAGLSFTLSYQPSTHLRNMLNGILLLKQRHS